VHVYRSGVPLRRHHGVDSERFYKESYERIYYQWSSKIGQNAKYEFYDVAAISGDTVAATVPGAKQIQIHTKGSKTGAAKALIKLTDIPYGITKVAERGMLVMCDGNPKSIRVMKPDGTLLYLFNIQQGKTVSVGETYIATDATASCIVATDSEQNCVQRFSSDGVLQWETNVPGASGVVILWSYILVAAKTDGKVHVLDMEGHIVKTLIDTNDGISNPRMLAVSPDEKLLLVFEEGQRSVRQFRIRKPSDKPPSLSDLFI
jgi:hypothetical protein